MLVHPSPISDECYQTNATGGAVLPTHRLVDLARNVGELNCIQQFKRKMPMMTGLSFSDTK
jgi:hypothetical protein